MKALITSLLLAGATSAPGAIVLLAHQNIPIPTSFFGVSVDLESGATETDFDGIVGGDANFVLGGGGITNDADRSAAIPSWQPLRTGPSNTDALRNLGIGEVVDAGSSSYSTGFGGSGDPNSHFPEFTPGTPGYIGFSLVLDNNDVVYGWMSVTLQDNNAPGGLIHGWAYENSGGPISVGVPEPSSALLALIALGGFALRRRR